MRKNPFQSRFRLGVLSAAIVVLALCSTGVLADPEDTQMAAGCGEVPMPEPSTWVGVGTLLAGSLLASLRRKKNAS